MFVWDWIIFIGWLPKWFGGLDTNATIILITLLFVYAIYTLGEMIMSPVQMTFVANLAPEHLRGTYMGLQVCSGLQEVHSAHFLEVFIRPITWPLLFTILAVGCVVAGIVYISLDRLVEQRQKAH